MATRTILTESGRQILLSQTGRALRGPVPVDVPPDDFTITPGDVGGFSANTLDATNATNPAGSVFENSTYTDDPVKYFESTDHTKFAALSINESRDQSVTFWCASGHAYLRVHSNGKAIYCAISFTAASGGRLDIGVVNGLSEASYPGGTYHRLFRKDDIETDYGVLLTGSDDQRFRFGVEGYDIFFEVIDSGVPTEVIRIKDYHHMVVSGEGQAEGKIGLKHADTFGFRTTDFDFETDAFLYSDLDAATPIFDLRDLGLKDVSTTGSISASSTTLTVVDATDFNVGDYIIVEIGGEAGAGARGTAGVGGTWPALSYADATARAADTSQANGTYAWQEDTGNVYRWATGSPGSWTQQTAYYTAKAVPRALVKARVTAKAGNDLTLSVAASETATNASVYFDNMPILNHLAQRYAHDNTQIRDIAPYPIIMRLPAGDFAISGMVQMQVLEGMTLRGAGKTLTRIFSPDGCVSASVRVNQGGNNATVEDLHIHGNARQEGFGLAWENTSWTARGPYHADGYLVIDSNAYFGGFVTETSVAQGTAFPEGCLFKQVSGAIMRDCKGTDVFQQFFGASFCANPHAYDCEYFHTEPLRQYIQWQYLIADSTGGSFTRCSFDSDYLQSAMEIFRSEGASMVSPVSRNGGFSLNTSNNWAITNPTITINAMSQFDSIAFNEENPIINVNFNIGGADVSDGGTISNVSLTQEGAINADDDLLSGIVVSSSTPAVTINGGTITMPNYIVGGREDYAAFLSNGANCDVANLTGTGQSRFGVTEAANPGNGVGNRFVHHRNSSTIANGSSVDAFTQANVPDYFIA